LLDRHSGRVQFLEQAMVPVLIGARFLLGGAQPATSPLPAAWHGTWVGKLNIAGPGDKRHDVPISLKIEPIKNSRDVTWATTFGTGEKSMLRDYKLVPDGDKAGRFRIDEQNGVALDAWLVNRVLYSQFEVGGSFLTARYELRGNTLFLEITSTKPAAEKVAKGKVQPQSLEVVQTAELQKSAK
jgi:hypothetical protein